MLSVRVSPVIEKVPVRVCKEGDGATEAEGDWLGEGERSDARPAPLRSTVLGSCFEPSFHPTATRTTTATVAATSANLLLEAAAGPFDPGDAG
jgi:hypothetical protein